MSRKKVGIQLPKQAQNRLDNLDQAFSLDRFTGEIKVRDASLINLNNPHTLRVTANGGEVIEVTINIT
ncbi:MAG: hypothetical protein AAF497_24180 [Planctomycetota bacterium]